MPALLVRFFTVARTDQLVHGQRWTCDDAKLALTCSASSNGEAPSASWVFSLGGCQSKGRARPASKSA